MSDPRVIKKYPNRRLYDTVESRYITLADVKRLVVEKIDFVVVDKKSSSDITRSILLQVIAEQEHLPEPLLTQDFLIGVIRSYGSGVQGSVPDAHPRHRDGPRRIKSHQMRQRCDGGHKGCRRP